MKNNLFFVQTQNICLFNYSIYIDDVATPSLFAFCTVNAVVLVVGYKGIPHGHRLHNDRPKRRQATSNVWTCFINCALNLGRLRENLSLEKQLFIHFH